MAAAALRYHPASAERRRSFAALLVELFFDLVALAEVERFVEAGAKEASASARAARMPGITSVTAFEANPFTYKRFASRLDQLPLRYEHLALCDAPGEVTFRVLLDREGRPSANGRGSMFRRIRYEPGFDEVLVPAVTLDGYFEADRGRPTAIWIDVEGASGDVLRGAQHLLSDTAVVIIEVEERPVWAGDHWLRPSIVSFLHQHGLTPVARDLQSRFQHNIVLVRGDLLDRPAIRARLARWAHDVHVSPTPVPRAAIT
jgi:FkbM family methyltransferase